MRLSQFRIIHTSLPQVKNFVLLEGKRGNKGTVVEIMGNLQFYLSSYNFSDTMNSKHLLIR